LARASGGVPYNGLLDEAAVFDYELTGAQASALFAASQAETVPEPAMVSLLGIAGLLIYGQRRRGRK